MTRLAVLVLWVLRGRLVVTVGMGRSARLVGVALMVWTAKLVVMAPPASLALMVWVSLALMVSMASRDRTVRVGRMGRLVRRGSGDLRVLPAPRAKLARLGLLDLLDLLDLPDLPALLGLPDLLDPQSWASRAPQRC